MTTEGAYRGLAPNRSLLSGGIPRDRSQDPTTVTPGQYVDPVAPLPGKSLAQTGQVAVEIAIGPIDKITGEPLSWKSSGNCQGVDPDLFFPERGASTREAKEVCRGCTVRPDCLEFALDNGEKFGIWGGASERERRRLRRQRALARRDLEDKS